MLGRDEGRPVDFLEIDGDVAAQHATELENAIWQHLPDLRPVSDDQIGNYLDRAEKKHSSPLAVTQLLITYHLFAQVHRPLPVAVCTPGCRPEPTWVHADAAAFERAGSGWQVADELATADEEGDNGASVIKAAAAIFYD